MCVCVCNLEGFAMLNLMLENEMSLILILGLQNEQWNEIRANWYHKTQELLYATNKPLGSWVLMWSLSLANSDCRE